MSPQTLQRSFKRKYKKLHGQVTVVQASTALLEEELKTNTAIALKLVADKDMLLDLLLDISRDKRPIEVKDQIATGTYGDYYTTDVPAHFSSMPWDLDRNSYSGSHLEDLAKAASQAAPTQQPQIAETPAPASTKKSTFKQSSSKKRDRNDIEELNGLSNKKKKRKSMAITNKDGWDV